MSENDVPAYREAFEQMSLAKTIFTDSYNSCKHSSYEVPISSGNDATVEVLVHRP